MSDPRVLSREEVARLRAAVDDDQVIEGWELDLLRTLEAAYAALDGPAGGTMKRSGTLHFPVCNEFCEGDLHYLDTLAPDPLLVALVTTARNYVEALRGERRAFPMTSGEHDAAVRRSAANDDFIFALDRAERALRCGAVEPGSIAIGEAHVCTDLRGHDGEHGWTRAEMDLAEERDPSAPWNTAGYGE